MSDLIFAGLFALIALRPTTSVRASDSSIGPMHAARERESERLKLHHCRIAGLRAAIPNARPHGKEDIGPRNMNAKSFSVICSMLKKLSSWPSCLARTVCSGVSSPITGINVPKVWVR